jgi:hypothetical protein
VSTAAFAGINFAVTFCSTGAAGLKCSINVRFGSITAVSVFFSKFTPGIGCRDAIGLFAEIQGTSRTSWSRFRV